VLGGGRDRNLYNNISVNNNCNNFKEEAKLIKHVLMRMMENREDKSKLLHNKEDIKRRLIESFDWQGKQSKIRRRGVPIPRFSGSTRLD